VKREREKEEEKNTRGKRKRERERQSGISTTRGGECDERKEREKESIVLREENIVLSLPRH